MQALTQQPSSLAGYLAEGLLKAWLRGDREEVSTQLDLSIALPDSIDDSGEDERRQLLKAVAGRMRKRSDLLETPQDNPEMELCLHLLGHMVPVYYRSEFAAA